MADRRDLPFATMRWRGELPHLEVPGGAYFITFCVDGVARMPLQRRAEDSADADAICHLSEPGTPSARSVELGGDSGRAVEQALLHFHGQRYGLYAWCVMPDHVHVVFHPLGAERLARIVHSWKSFTANAINRMLGRRGPVWERECFDHLVRSGPALARFVEYTEVNPVAAGLCREPWEWPLSSARYRR